MRVIRGSVWKLLSRLNDPDVMIRKLEVRGFDFDFRHVARGAIFVSHRTALAVAGFCSLIPQCMTFQTPLIVISSVFPERFVRVMTCRAAYVAIV